MVHHPQSEYWQLLDTVVFNAVTVQTSDEDTDCIHLMLKALDPGSCGLNTWLNQTSNVILWKQSSLCTLIPKW